MARAKKSTAKKSSKKIIVSKKQDLKSSVNYLSSQKWLKDLNLNESYVSLFLGAVVVVVLSVVFVMFIKSGSFNGTSELTTTKPLPSETTLQNPNTYTLKEGEGLWDVAVMYYGDGYKWVEIAKANNLTEEQAGKLGPGSKVIVPDLR